MKTKACANTIASFSLTSPRNRQQATGNRQQATGNRQQANFGIGLNFVKYLILNSYHFFIFFSFFDKNGGSSLNHRDF
jgi:hypothetical protein